MRSEQWLLNGDCIMCRRKEYCTKPCKQHTVRQKTELISHVAKAMAKTMFNPSN